MTSDSAADRQLVPPPHQPRARSVWSRPLTWVIAAVFGVLVVVALIVALAAALFVAATVAIAALILRLSPRRAVEDDGQTLEGRRTPDGWVVEAALRR